MIGRLVSGSGAAIAALTSATCEGGRLRRDGHHRDRGTGAAARVAPGQRPPAAQGAGDPRLLVGGRRVSILISVGIVLALFFRALNFLSDVELGSLWSGIWRPRQRQFDLLSLFLGSFVVTVIAMLVATPLGLGAAIYLSEYASPRARRTLKPILETLAGIPSVVIGFFAWRSSIRSRAGRVRRDEHVHDDGGGDRGRDPHDPARRLGRRGCDARGARAPP